jgi:hypothetical protein
MRLRSLLAGTLGLLALAYVGASAYVWHSQRWWVFWPEKEIEATPADFRLAYQDVYLPVGHEGEGGAAARIHGWWIPQPDPRAPALLYLHGGGRNVSKDAVHASHFWHMGFSVFIVDYRGSGLSEGELPAEATMYEDAQVAWAYLKMRQPDANRRYLYGHSIGGAVAVDLAVRTQDAAGLIVENTFTSMSDLVKTGAFMRLLPVDLILTQHFDSAAKIGALGMPLLMFHGAEDTIVPLALGERLFAAAPRPKTLVRVAGGGHSNNMTVGREQYWAAVERFVAGPSGN